MNYSTIDLIALSGKLGIEATSMNRFAKEGLKALIDCEASNTKNQLYLQQNFTVMGLPLNCINIIKSAAQQCGLDKVVLFPCPVNGTIIPCFSMEGENTVAFCQMIGQPMIKKTDVDINESELENLINGYGVILYQR